MKRIRSRPAAARPALAAICVYLSCAAWLGGPEAALAGASDPAAVGIAREMVAAHGGLEKWRSAPTVSFVDSFVPAGAPAGVVSRVTVEQGRRRAYLDYPGTGARITWDGERCWSEKWTLPSPPRFIALLNYYFLSLPWLTMDPGVNLNDAGTEKLASDPTEYVTVRMTFDPGVGDTPDDYYVLYIHPATKELKGCRYVVTYKALLPEGQTSTPEHLLVFDSFEAVDGLKVPTGYTIYENEKPYASCAVRGWSFTRAFDESRMTMPEGAVLDDSTP